LAVPGGFDADSDHAQDSVEVLGLVETWVKVRLVELSEQTTEFALADKVMVPTKPFNGATVIVDTPVVPELRLKLVGLAETL